jgi:hypothetical protein
LQICESDSDSSDDDSQVFWEIVLGGVKIVEQYFSLYLDKNPPRIAKYQWYGMVARNIEDTG